MPFGFLVLVSSVEQSAEVSFRKLLIGLELESVLVMYRLGIGGQ